MPTLSPKSPRRSLRKVWPKVRKGRLTPRNAFLLAICGLCLYLFFDLHRVERDTASAASRKGGPSGAFRTLSRQWLRPHGTAGSKTKQKKRAAAAKKGHHAPRKAHQVVLAESTPQPLIEPYAGEHDDVSLVEFLNSHVGSAEVKPTGRGVWLTLGDEKYVNKFLSHTRLYMDELESKPAFPTHDLVVLCLDYGCVDEGRRRNMLAYGGFIHDERRPEYVRNDTWAKAAGLAQTLGAGYHVVFFDADIFFRWDVFKAIPPLSEDTWDVQIQDESHDHFVNTGFMFIRGNEKTAAWWNYVLEQVINLGERDQAKTNVYFDSTNGRAEVEGQRVSNFTTPTGIRVEVLDPEYYWGMHMGWFTNAETTLLHLTCAPVLLKEIIAGAHGFRRDVEGLYSNPPPLLSLGTSLAGSHEEIGTMFRVLVAAAQASQRALVLPLTGAFTAPSHQLDGNRVLREGNVTHSRFVWSLFDLEPLLAPSSPVQLLEPNYPEHATPHLAKDAKQLAALHTVRELDLRPVFTFADLLRRLDQPYYRDAMHVRLITDESSNGWRANWGSWPEQFDQEVPDIRLCRSPEVVAGCGDLCRQ